MVVLGIAAVGVVVIGRTAGEIDVVDQDPNYRVVETPKRWEASRITRLRILWMRTTQITPSASLERVSGDKNCAQIGQPADGWEWSQPLESFAMFFGHEAGEIWVHKKYAPFPMKKEGRIPEKVASKRLSRNELPLYLRVAGYSNLFL